MSQGEVTFPNTQSVKCAGLLGPRVVSPHSQGLQGSHLNLSQTSAQRHRTYFLLNNKEYEFPDGRKNTPLLCLTLGMPL